jgi:hypothetical protein
MISHERERVALELCYADALEGIASGLPKDEVLEALGDLYGLTISVAEVERVALEAAKDSRRAGIDPADVDGTWKS